MDEDRPGDPPERGLEGQRDIASTERDVSSARRDESSTRRDGLSTERDGSSLDRDESAVQRDASSTRRDRVADDLDDEAARLDAKDDVADQHTLGAAELRGRSRSGRTRAAGDRARARNDREHSGDDRHHAQDDRSESRGDRLHALDDREHSSTDRERAGSDRGDAELDRDHAQLDRHSAGIDELTGARRRGVGLEDLKNEIARAHREGGDRLVVAYVDVDGLKSVNDAQGHSAGDELLRAVATGFRREMRAYDLLVRLGGDEFLGVLPKVGLDAARERFDRVQSGLARSGNAISIGYSELREGDSAAEVVERADAALLATRASGRRK